MEFDVQSPDIEVPEVSQIGIVVEDLDDGIERFKGMMGFGPWSIIRFEPPELHSTTYQGEETTYTFRIALATAGDIDIELIEPLTGENTYTEHLEGHGEGLHHIAYYAQGDSRETVDAFRDAGIPVVQSGIRDGNTFWYLDTREAMNGVLFEVVEQDGEESPNQER